MYGVDATVGEEKREGPSKHFRMGQYRTYMFCISGVPTDLQSDPHNGPTYGEISGRYQADIYISVE
jgi:hypothetical protein